MAIATAKQGKLDTYLLNGSLFNYRKKIYSCILYFQLIIFSFVFMLSHRSKRTRIVGRIWRSYKVECVLGKVVLEKD